MTEQVQYTDWNDGHKPGSTSTNTKMAHYLMKHSSKFISVFDDLIPSSWLDRTYIYAERKGSPWGK